MKLALVTSVIAVTALCGCRNDAVPPKAHGPVLDVCAAASQPIGSRISIRGELTRSTYGTNGFILSSEQACSARGAASVFTTLLNEAESAKRATAQPRPRRSAGTGDFITIEATLDRVGDGRFLHVSKALVREVTTGRRD
jgi:hypothetical protein